MAIARDPAIRRTHQPHSAGHPAHCPQRPRPPDAPCNRDEGGRAAKHGTVVETDTHFVEEMVIGDAEQARHVWRL
jgi:hypothetical protein